MTGPTFYLGTHHPDWLGRPEFADVPLFISRNRLVGRKTFPRAAGRWAMDSGGFTEISMHGRWRTGPGEFVAQVRRIIDGIGRAPDFVAPQDWMCEPVMLAKTGLTVAEHQQRTVANLLELRQLAPEVPWMPVLQGWTLADYLRCADLYAAAGVDLVAEPIVGLGSVCRRQATSEIDGIVATLHGRGLRLHGFGVKTGGLADYGPELSSADSLAWSYDARRNPPLTGHTHKNCANCWEWALRWRRRVLDAIDHPRPRQLAIDLTAA